MKFARRRAADAPGARAAAEIPQDTPAPPPTPPRRSPVSAYAGIVDGQTLWLAVEATAGALAFRASEDGDVVAVRSDLAEDQPAYRSIRVDLAELAGDGPASYDVVLVPAGGGSPKPVWSPPLPAGEPLTIPPARDGRTQFALSRTDDGFLRIERRALAPAAELRQVCLGGDGIELTVDPVAGVASTLLLLDQQAPEVVASIPLEPTASGWRGVVTLDPLPTGSDRVLRVGVGSAESWQPVRRRHNDLVNPNRAVLLPQLYDDDGPRLRMRWTGAGLLQVRLLEADPSGPGAEDDA
ncbi:MAG: hypothetical protein JWO11_803 [Nocardioides sp.]|nr:hypothetical protein [Nocardioides sp.]